MVRMAIDMMIKEAIVKLVLFALVCLIVNGIYQSMAQEPRTYDAYGKLYVEVTK